MQIYLGIKRFACTLATISLPVAIKLNNSEMENPSCCNKTAGTLRYSSCLLVKKWRSSRQEQLYFVC